MHLRITYVLIAFILLYGCAAPSVIDLSNSIYLSPNIQHSQSRRISSIDFINNAKPAGFSPLANLKMEAHTPINPETPTHATVEEDIKRYFGEQLLVVPSTQRTLRITLTNADAYWVSDDAISLIPYIDLARVASDKEFGINLYVLIEILEAKRLIASYNYNKTIKIQGKAFDREDIANSYRNLIAEYRQDLFSGLDTEFVIKYF